MLHIMSSKDDVVLVAAALTNAVLSPLLAAGVVAVALAVVVALARQGAEGGCPKNFC
jgi:hypothetical protein